ncbi:unnamed protein product [Spirodela intermedia]|uniref:RING-type E3 ubiquitin transferase n=1 Tax=Spirodela intermedia TaxID=51605 RepID=A0A7I8KQM1_SPIIN|nr:unnamed protein product [Spirodela intermedia]
MDDTCVVCAESLEWVGYGSCGHREVCSTCVVRMRFVLDDRRCCLCKIESPTVFITKALGDYTRVITDFSQFPVGVSEGQVGNYWYHEDTQAYFDDVDHYRMIKAMCRLSCSICDRRGEDAEGGGKRRSRFRNIEQLKSHLYHRHKLFMCTLCLEGRKVFICEQKLYTKAQLNRHISGGDSEVDGSESERGGFMGHPMCEFCRTPFYGDNELYTHMSTEHYTCHICQRQHPGQYDYFRNYDDLEIHFRQEHHLCENEACLAKKFIVFPSDSELKRHNAVEHGGNMSRSKRNAALQIPTSFRYRRAEQEQRRGRGHGPHSQSSDNQLAMAIQASLEAANTMDSRARDPDRQQVSRVDAVTSRIESLAVAPPERAPPPSRPPLQASQSSRDAPVIEESSFPPLSDREPPEPSSRYALALVQGSTGPSRLGGEAFPPLPGALEAGQQKPPVQQGKSTIAAHLRQRSKVALRPVKARPSEHPEFQPPMPVSSPQLWPTPSQEFRPSNSTRSSSQPRAAASSDPTSSSGKKTIGSEPPWPNNSASSSWGLSGTRRLSHSSSAPDLVVKDTSTSNGFQTTGQVAIPDEEAIRTANKTLVERIRVDLGNDGDKFAVFKHISSEYRQGLTDAREYLSYVEQFGLLHLVPELARLCPDPQKQIKLLDAYSAKLQTKGRRETGGGTSAGKPQTKGKGKSAEPPPAAGGGSKDSLADGILDTVRKLQATYKPDEEVEVLSKDGYRTYSKGKLVATAREDQQPPGASADQNSAAGSSTKQRPKKMSRFHRVRLGGDGSVIPEPAEEEPPASGAEGNPVRGVWRHGGQKLFAPSGGHTR